MDLPVFLMDWPSQVRIITFLSGIHSVFNLRGKKKYSMIENTSKAICWDLEVFGEIGPQSLGMKMETAFQDTMG